MQEREPIKDAAAFLLADGWHLLDEGSFQFEVWAYDRIAAVQWTENGQLFRCPVQSVLAARWAAP